MPRVKTTARPGARSAMAPPRMPDRPGRLKLLWKRQRRLVRPGLALLGLCVAGAGLYAAVQTFSGDSFRERVGQATASLGLRVQRVVIEGRQKTPEPLLWAALAVHEGDPILDFSIEEARARVERINWVQAATIERRLPGTILVQLQERRPFAVWQNQGRFVLIDRKGGIVTDSDVAAFARDVPLVVGAGAPQAASALIDALAAYPDVQSRMVAAVRVGERRWNLRMNNGADVLLPEGAEAPALKKLAELQSSLALLDRPLQVVDLRLPDRLVVRPQPEKPDPKEGGKPARKPT
jgi:cell division protein FtsQ